MTTKINSGTKTLALICASALLMGALLLGTMVAPTMAKSMEEVLAGNHRSEAHKARDKYRHPKETLAFFGLKADMTVVEVSPGGGGWYQEILAPFLHDKGTYYSAGYDLSLTEGYAFRNNQMLAKRLASDASLYGKVIVTELAPPTKLAIAPPGSADMVLSFRNFHNWQDRNQENNVIKAIYKALKPGGIFGITDHRSDDPKKDDGYVKTSAVIAVAKAAGFVLVAESEINANPKDTHHHERGVWTLLPNLGGKEADHDRLRAIGESDRMTLKFMKPAK